MTEEMLSPLWVVNAGRLFAALTDCVTHLAFSTCLLELQCLFMALSSQADSKLSRFIFYPQHLTQSLTHSRQAINVCVET